MPIWLAPIAKWLGHWMVYFLLSAIVGWGLYAGLIRPVTKPNPSQQQTATNIYNLTPKQNFGCIHYAVPKEQK
jgi:hypothetical protein